MSTSSLRLAASLLPLATMCLACLVPEDGERAVTGACPEGEVCSAATPEGLVFGGRTLSSTPEGETQIGPVIAGGVIEVSIETPRGTLLPPFRAVSDSPDIFDLTANDDRFGRPSDLTGEAAAPAFVTLRAERAGTARLRVLDSVTGELFDRTSVAVVDLTDVRIVGLSGPTSDALLAGCRAEVSIELIAAGPSGELRAIDDGLRASVGGVELALDPFDLVTFMPPADASSVELEVTAGGRRYVRSLPLRSLRDAGLPDCPGMGL